MEKKNHFVVGPNKGESKFIFEEKPYFFLYDYNPISLQSQKSGTIIIENKEPSILIFFLKWIKVCSVFILGIAISIAIFYLISIIEYNEVTILSYISACYFTIQLGRLCFLIANYIFES